MGDYAVDRQGLPRKVGFGADESDDSHKDTLASERKTFTADSVGGAKKTPKSAMPKQADFATIGAWQSALREWRASDSDSGQMGRAAAIKGKLSAQ